jgi:hypothetical protein
MHKQPNLTITVVTISTKTLLIASDVSYLTATNMEPDANGEITAKKMYEIMHGEKYGYARKKFLPLIIQSYALHQCQKISRNNC